MENQYAEFVSIDNQSSSLSLNNSLEDYDSDNN